MRQPCSDCVVLPDGRWWCDMNCGPCLPPSAPTARFRIRFRPTLFMAFDAPNPWPWLLEIPAGLKIGNERIPESSSHKTFDGAFRALQYVLEMQKRGHLHR